ncbi:unnamed protein product, partial [marine sediment metagenome]
SETSDSEYSSILEAFNSFENRHGEYIKAVIGSPKTRDGINLANVIQIHLLGPDWNQAASYQAESRAVRSTSHVDLITEERARLIEEGKNPDDAFVDINIYRHASLNNSGKSIDLMMYQLSEVKDRKISHVMRLIKQCSTDCQINYNRNVRSTDIDYSSNCDYDICKYDCVDPLPEYIDYTSYDVLYTGKIVNEVVNRLIDIFKIEFHIKFNKLYNILNKYRKKIIDLGVTQLIQNKTEMIDRYGYINYLREDSGVIFLRKDYPLETKEIKGGYSLSVYNES